ncbi:glycosyltransferase family 4 protein [Nonomuraea rhizosphaerae]|uniref:glycosyltransferase family 4 protein n=1 Tax=Nonomuraea rhizosphaerae TaxID=2665663 RepID=UPI001C5F779D|nr:glycosyltransferase family 4 protein [Nonomuraea rhizosphaerae]
MRVAFVLGTTSGGTGRHVRMLTEGLVARGHRVVVAGPRSVEERFGFGAAGARFVEVTVSDRPHPVNDARAALTLRRVTRDADVVHAHGLRAGALAGLAVPRRVPLVVTLHNALTAGGLIGFVYGVLERVVARTAGHVLVVSPDLGERMRELGARDVRAAVVPAPVPRPARRSPREIRDELKAGERPIVLTVARLAQQKGYETLLDAARGPWEAGPDGLVSGDAMSEAGGDAGGKARGPVGGHPAGEVQGSGDGDVGTTPLFVVAGEGPLFDEMRRRIDDERLPVTLLGNRDDVPDLLAAATVVVWPSRWEGQPLSLSETLMCGRPVIATAVGGVPDLLAGAGILVPYGDAEALRSAVRKVTGDPAEAERLAAAAARRGGELPGQNEAVESVLDVYDRQIPQG